MPVAILVGEDHRFVTPASRLRAWSTVPLLHTPLIQSATEAWSRRLAPAGPTPLTRATRKGWWTRDWVSWAGQGRMERKLERVDWTPPDHATGRGHQDTDARPRRLVPTEL